MGSRPKRTSFRSPWQNGVAERWVLPPRFARSCDRAQREAPETPSQRIRPLLSRRPHTSRTRQGDSRWEGAIYVGWPGHRARKAGRPAPPLRPSCVEKRETKTFQREISVQVRLFASTEARGALPIPFLCCWFPARNNSSSDSESRLAFWRTSAFSCILLKPKLPQSFCEFSVGGVVRDFCNVIHIE